MITLNRSHIQKLYNELFNFSIYIAKLCKTIMNGALSYALEHNIISFNPSKEVIFLREQKRKSIKLGR